MADEQIVTNIVANADFSNLIGDLNKVTVALSRMQSELKSTQRSLGNQIRAINTQFGETLRSTGQFTSHFVTISSDVEKFGRSLDSGKMKLGQYFKVWQEHHRTAGGLVRDLAKQQVQMQNAILQPLGKNAEGMMRFAVHVPKGLDLIRNKTALTRQELAIMNKVVQDGAQQLINWGKNTQWAGRQLTVGLTVPLVAFGKASADAFRAADQELVRLTKVYGDLGNTTSANLAQVRKDVIATARELSNTMGVSFKDTIALGADIAATGKQGQELLSSISETTRLAVLGEVDRQDAMKATLAIQSAFKANTEELADSINFLNAVENQTSTTLADLVEAIPKAGPVIKGLGGSVQDLALYLTAMREGGINATEGANALKSALASLINPTDVAVNKFKGFGIDLLGIVNNNAGNVTKTLLALQSSLDQLDPLSKQQAIEQLFGKFQFSRLNALFENLGKQGSQTLKVLDLMKTSSQDLANIASRELSQVTESASGKYKRALETLKADLAQTGEQFLSIATKVINATDKIINFVNNLPEPLKKILGLAGGFTALVGPLIMLTGVLGNFFGYIVKGIYHFKALFKGAEGWKLLTPEIMAANNAGTLIEKTFYSDAKAAGVLHKAILDLTAQYNGLAEAASRAAIGTGAVSTTAGSPVIMSTPGGGKRVVDPTHPLAGREGTRSFAHMIPRKVDQPGSIFGVVQSSGPVNTLVGENPMIYAQGDLPGIPGLTTIERTVKTAAGRQPMAVSTGVISDEVAKQHAMTAALAMQSKDELIQIEKTLKDSGMLTVDFMQTFDDLLPETTRIANNAANASKAIIAEVQAGKVTVDQARAQIIALNAAVEKEIIETMSLIAARRGAAFDPYTVPLLSQPAITATGKSNMKELFHKDNTRDLVNQIATMLGVRTSGAGYNVETTIPAGARRGYRQLSLPGFETGGQIADGVYTLNDGNIVPGPKHINKDIQFGILPVDSFVVNQGATKNNLEFLQGMVGDKNNLTTGGQPVMLSPWEFVVPPEVVNEGNNLEILKGINSGQITFSNTGGKVPMLQYFAAVNAGRRVTNKVSPLKVTLSKSKIKKVAPEWRGGKDATRKDTWNLKPASGGVYAVDAPGTGLNEKLATTGASATTYLEALKQAALLKGSKNAVVGSTDDFLNALVAAGKITPSEASRILKDLSKAYVARVKEMGIIKDPTNPYHDLSTEVISSSESRSAILPWWNEFRIKTGSIEKNRPVGYKGSSGASGSAKNTTLIVNGEVIKVKPFEGSTDLSIKGLHGANKDWSSFIEESLGTGVMAALTGGLLQKFAGFMPNRRVQRKTDTTPVPREIWEPGATPDWIIRNEKTNLSNTNPNHGPLQIGRYQPPLTIRNRRVPAGIMYRGNYTKSVWNQGPKKGEEYWSPRSTSKVEAFLTGDERARANYVIEEYMRGAYSVMGMKGAADALRAIATKVSGRFYRGVTVGGWSRVGGQMSAFPEWLTSELKVAQKTGDFSNLIGREFILRRSSWSQNPATAKGFGDFFITADVKNRNAVRASDMFPDLRFPDPKTGQMLPVNESESFFGGKFRIVKANKNGMYVQSVNSPMGGNRAMGGDVNAGTPYVVGENGPELFIPRQSGGIVPNSLIQNRLSGGAIKALWTAIRNALSRSKSVKTPAAAPQTAGQLELDLGGATAGATDIAASEFNPYGMKGQMIGLGGSLVGGAVGNSVAGMPGMMVGSMVGNMAMFLPQLLKARGLVGGIGQALSKLFWPAALITGAIALGKWLLDLKKKYEDLGKANRLAFGGTKESFESVGIKNYKTMSDRIRDINEQLELHRAKVKSVYESYTKTGVSGLSLTIEELRKAIENAKTNQKEYVEAFNNIDSSKVVQYAAQLKAQFVAMGMSAQEATNQIYAIVKASDKAAQAFASITSKGFTSIQTNLDGIKFIIDYLSKSLGKTFNIEEFNQGLDTLLNSILAYRDSLIGVADDQKNIRDEADATAETLDKISKLQGAQATMSKEQIDSLKSQNIVYAAILGNAESLESVAAKILLYSSGLQQVVDLGKMSAEAAIELAKNFTTVQNIMNSVTEDINTADNFRNSLDPLAQLINKIQIDSDKAADAVKRLKKVDEDYYKNKMKAIDDLIKKLQKERDERLKLIDLQERASTFENQLKSAQIKYQQALTAGNLSQAAQEQLNINQLSSDRQRQLLRDSINEKYNNEIEKLQEQKDKLQTELDNANKTYNAKTAAATEKAAQLAKVKEYRDELEQIALRNINGPINKTDAMRIENIFKEMTDAGGELKKAADLMRAGNPAVVPAHPKGVGKSFAQVLVDNLNADVKSRASENATFKTAVEEFTRAVDKFKGGTSPDYFDPGKNEKNEKGWLSATAAALGITDNTPFDTSTMIVQNPKTMATYYIPLDSPRFKDAYKDIVKKGYHFIGWQKSVPQDLTNVYLDPNKLPKAAFGREIKGYSLAGQISGQGGTGTSDDILIRASQGEFMINANSATNAGMENLHAINQKGAQGIIESAMRLLSGKKGGGFVGYDSVKDYFSMLGDLSVNFPTDVSELPESQKRELLSIAQKLAGGKAKTLLVKGYADKRGSTKYNMALSKRRAETVAAFLSDVLPNITFIPVAEGELGSSSGLTALAKRRRVSIELPPQSPGLSLPNEPRGMLGSVPFEGLFGGGLGFGGMMTMARGGHIPGYSKAGPVMPNPFAMGMEWFGNQITKGMSSVSKFMTGVDPLNPFGPKSAGDYLAMATFGLPIGKVRFGSKAYEGLLDTVLKNKAILPALPKNAKNAKFYSKMYGQESKTWSKIAKEAKKKNPSTTVGEFNTNVKNAYERIALEKNLDDFSKFTADSAEMEAFTKDPWQFLSKDSPEGFGAGIKEVRTPSSLNERSLGVGYSAPENISLVDYYLGKATEFKTISQTYKALQKVIASDPEMAARLGLIGKAKGGIIPGYSKAGQIMPNPFAYGMGWVGDQFSKVGKPLATGSKWIMNNFLGIDDFARAYKYGRQGSFGKSAKSLGTGILEGGTTIFGGAILKPLKYAFSPIAKLIAPSMAKMLTGPKAAREFGKAANLIHDTNHPEWLNYRNKFGNILGRDWSRSSETASQMARSVLKDAPGSKLHNALEGMFAQLAAKGLDGSQILANPEFEALRAQVGLAPEYVNNMWSHIGHLSRATEPEIVAHYADELEKIIYSEKGAAAYLKSPATFFSRLKDKILEGQAAKKSGFSAFGTLGIASKLLSSGSGFNPARSYLETILGRTRSNKTDLGSSLMHPQDVPISTGRAYGPGTYFARTMSLSNQLFSNFGNNIYKTKLNAKGLLKTLFSKGYINEQEFYTKLAEFNQKSGTMHGIGGMEWANPFIQQLLGEGYLGLKHKQALTNWLIGVPGSGFTLKPTFAVGTKTDEVIRKIHEGGLAGILKQASKLSIAGRLSLPFMGSLYGQSQQNKNVGKLHTLKGPIPGPYGAEVGALVRAKTESIYPTGYVESLQNATIGGNTYVLKNEIHASQDMDVNQLADVVTKRTVDAIKGINSLNAKSTGTNRRYGGLAV